MLLQDVLYVQMEPVTFTPVSLPNMALHPKYENQLCHGLKFKVLHPEKFQAVRFAVQLLYSLSQLYPDDFRIDRVQMGRLAGTDSVFDSIANAVDAQTLVASWEDETTEFLKVREKYLLYPNH